MKATPEEIERVVKQIRVEYPSLKETQLRHLVHEAIANNGRKKVYDDLGGWASLRDPNDSKTRGSVAGLRFEGRMDAEEFVIEPKTVADQASVDKQMAKAHRDGEEYMGTRRLNREFGEEGRRNQLVHDAKMYIDYTLKVKQIPPKEVSHRVLKP